ncbi:MAG: PGF-CTERM sorting domain-containing protein, partial [Halococcoides sp.]
TPTATETPTETATPGPKDPTVSATAGSVPPGENVTVEVTAETVGTLSLSGIPTGWSVDASSTAGASPLVNETNGTQKVAWTWNANQDSVSVTVTLGIPGDATLDDTVLTAEASNAYDHYANDTATVSVTQAPTATATETASQNDGGSNDGGSNGGGGIGGDGFDFDEETTTADSGGGEPVDPVDTTTTTVSEGAAEPSTPETTTSTETTEQSMKKTTTDTSGPGFGSVLALIALVAAALVAMGRRDSR